MFDILGRRAFAIRARHVRDVRSESRFQETSSARTASCWHAALRSRPNQGEATGSLLDVEQFNVEE